MTDTSKYKSRIPEYLSARGIEITMDGSTRRIRCNHLLEDLA